MNQRAQQEILIAEKLEQLSIPDMVDAIWSRIEVQLDIDLPTDDGPAGPDVPAPSDKGTWIKPGIFLVVTAFFLATYFIINKKNTSNNPIPVKTENPGSISPDQQDTGPPGNQGIRNQQPRQTPSNGQLIPFTDSQAIDSPEPIDNLQTDSNPLPVNDDSRVISLPPVDVIKPDTTGKKKSRGVKGINPGDYKVVPSKKDSAE
jgi:hypothetical protein